MFLAIFVGYTKIIFRYDFVAPLRMLKTNLLGLISRFSKYYLKTGTVCLLFLSSNVFIALEFDSNHFGHQAIMKLTLQFEKYSENMNHSDIIL